MKLEHSIVILFIILGITNLILGTSIVMNKERIKTNEALINYMHHEIETQNNIISVHNEIIMTILDDPFIAELWFNSIHNPENQPYVLECAFNLNISIDSVTQEQFNHRYLFRKQ